MLVRRRYLRRLILVFTVCQSQELLTLGIDWLFSQTTKDLLPVFHVLHLSFAAHIKETDINRKAVEIIYIQNFTTFCCVYFGLIAEVQIFVEKNHFRGPENFEIFPGQCKMNEVLESIGHRYNMVCIWALEKTTNTTNVNKFVSFLFYKVLNSVGTKSLLRTLYIYIDV